MQFNLVNDQGPVVRSLVSANRWLRSIKTYRFPWYLTLVSANHASSNPGLMFIWVSRGHWLLSLYVDTLLLPFFLWSYDTYCIISAVSSYCGYIIVNIVDNTVAAMLLHCCNFLDILLPYCCHILSSSLARLSLSCHIVAALLLTLFLYCLLGKSGHWWRGIRWTAGRCRSALQVRKRNDLFLWFEWNIRIQKEL